MSRKAGVLSRFTARLDTRPIHSKHPDHNHAFRFRPKVKDLPPEFAVGTWYRCTTTTDSQYFLLKPVDKARYNAKPPKGVYTVNPEPNGGRPPTRVSMLVSPGLFEPMAPHTVKAYMMKDGTLHIKASLDRVNSATGRSMRDSLARTSGHKRKVHEVEEPTTFPVDGEGAKAATALARLEYDKPTATDLMRREIRREELVESLLNAPSGPAALAEVVRILEPLKSRDRERVIRSALTFLGDWPPTPEA